MDGQLRAGRLSLMSAVIEPSLTLMRRFEAPVSLVFAAWTEPERMLQWWATKDAVTLRAEADLRAGGGFRVAFRTPDGETHDVSGAYLEIEKNRKLVFTWAWITTPERRSRVTLLFKDEGEKTLLTLIHDRFFDEGARDDHRNGWSQALDNLDRFIISACGSSGA